MHPSCRHRPPEGQGATQGCAVCAPLTRYHALPPQAQAAREARLYSGVRRMRSMSQAVYGKVQDMQDSFLHKVAEAHLLPQRQRRRPSAGSSAACKREGLGNSPRISAAGSAPAAQAAKRTGSLRVPPVRGSVIEMVSDEVRAWYCIMSCKYWMTPSVQGA